MAIKKSTVAKKSTTKKVASKPKSKSRGSNTETQVGNDNQREAYNSIRDTRSAKEDGSSYSTSSRSKVSSQDVKALKKWESQGKAEGMAFSPAFMAARSRKMQRAGGKVGSTSAGKSNPKANKSRGSNSATQVGNDNQREGYNASRDMKQKRSKSGKIIGKTIPKFKVSKADSDSQGFDMTDMRKSQRAGGKGK